MVFLNTDAIPAPESRRTGEILQNSVEVILVCQTIKAFLLCGVPADSLGVISPYRAQLKMIKNVLGNKCEVEVHTVDKFQGRDKDCILVSLVRSNVNKNVNSFFKT